jgi:ParB/RepB/Spo0J family partition protein
MTKVPISLIDRPRIPLRRIRVTDPEYLEVRQSIHTVGQLVPIVVRKVGKRYEIIDGYNRYSILKSLGIKEISIEVKEANDRAAMLMTIAANLHRIQTRPQEYAAHLHRLREEGMTLRELARLVGKSHSWVNNILGLRSLMPKVAEAMNEGKIGLDLAIQLSHVRPPFKQQSFLKLVGKVSNGELKRHIIDFVKATMERVRNKKLHDTFVEWKPHPYLRNLWEVEDELKELKAAASCLRDAKTPLDGFVAGLKWASNLDPDTVAVRRERASLLSTTVPIPGRETDKHTHS